MNEDIKKYNDSLSASDAIICNTLESKIRKYLVISSSKVWHGHPVWFIDGNPIVGYSKLKQGVQLLFWSGQSFGEEKLQSEGKFKAANIFYTSVEEINESELKVWLKKAEDIQWDYKNIVKHRGVLNRLK